MGICIRQQTHVIRRKKNFLKLLKIQQNFLVLVNFHKGLLTAFTKRIINMSLALLYQLALFICSFLPYALISCTYMALMFGLAQPIFLLKVVNYQFQK